MEKINVAELLKDCPSGMELDCASYDNVSFDKISDDKKATYPIFCYITDKEGNRSSISFTENGCESKRYGAKCVIFPKGKTTWEGFVPPLNLKNGDVIYVKDAYGREWCSIIDNCKHGALYTYVDICIESNKLYRGECDCKDMIEYRLATEEEKQKLFDAIKADGYKWNAETKALEKLHKPKFKKGDSVKSKINQYIYTITDIAEDVYIMHYATDYVTDKFGYHVPFCDEDKFELVSNKFDITTLIPFESKVLVRGDKTSYWKPAIFGCYMKNRTAPYYALGGTCWSQCVPYEGNEHLLGKTDDCDEFYKTWE